MEPLVFVASIKIVFSNCRINIAALFSLHAIEEKSSHLQFWFQNMCDHAESLDEVPHKTSPETVVDPLTIKLVSRVQSVYKLYRLTEASNSPCSWHLYALSKWVCNYGAMERVSDPFQNSCFKIKMYEPHNSVESLE